MKSEYNIGKLELIYELRRRYKLWIRPDLSSIKLCQSPREVFIEMIFSNSFDVPITFDLDFIVNDHPDDNVFKVNTDIVDNAILFVELDSYSLINCIKGLFTRKAENIICEEFQRDREVSVR